MIMNILKQDQVIYNTFISPMVTQLMVEDVILIYTRKEFMKCFKQMVDIGWILLPGRGVRIQILLLYIVNCLCTLCITNNNKHFFLNRSS